MIKLKKINISFQNKKIINNCSYSFLDNKFYLISARNGTGKTTLFNAISNLIDYEGIIETDFKADKFIYIPNDYSFSNNMTGMDYLILFKNLWNSSSNIKKIISDLNITDFINKKISSYSLGMQQLFILSLYIVTDTTTWLVDELNNGLDKDNLIVLKNELLKAKNKNKSILFITHQPEDVVDIADTTLILERGVLNERLE